ncbi:MAG TPA: hypothetical protein VF315_05945 [Steroidobacteraceae bacterium]
MSAAWHSVADFAGAVCVSRAPADALQLELAGRDLQGRRTSVAFARPTATLQIPHQLHGVQVLLSGAAAHGAQPAASGSHSVRIAASEGTYEFAIARVHVHRDLSAELRRVVAPRAAPWRKRMLWRIALALAATAPGRRLLRAVPRS